MKSTIVLFVFAMCCVTMSQAKLQCEYTYSTECPWEMVLYI